MPLGQNVPLHIATSRSMSFIYIYIRPYTCILRIVGHLPSFTAHLDNCPLRRIQSQVGNRRWHSFSTDQRSSSIRSTPETHPYYAHSLCGLKWVWPQTGTSPMHSSTKFNVVTKRKVCLYFIAVRVRFLASTKNYIRILIIRKCLWVCVPHHN